MVEAYLVDTGVFLRWYVDQAGFEHAREMRDRFLAGELRLETVDSVRLECANVLRTKGLLTGRLDADEYVVAVRALDDLGVVVHDTDVDSVELAAKLVVQRNLGFFDAVVAERALRTGLPLLTTDKGLCNAMAGLLPTELLRGIA